MPHSKRMQSDLLERYAPAVAVKRGRYQSTD